MGFAATLGATGNKTLNFAELTWRRTTPDGKNNNHYASGIFSRRITFLQTWLGPAFLRFVLLGHLGCGGGWGAVITIINVLSTRGFGTHMMLRWTGLIILVYIYFVARHLTKTLCRAQRCSCQYWNDSCWKSWKMPPNSLSSQSPMIMTRRLGNGASFTMLMRHHSYYPQVEMRETEVLALWRNTKPSKKRNVFFCEISILKFVVIIQGFLINPDRITTQKEPRFV